MGASGKRCSSLDERSHVVRNRWRSGLRRGSKTIVSDQIIDHCRRQLGACQESAEMKERGKRTFSDVAGMVPLKHV